MVAIPVYVLASVAEIGGCYAFWAWLRLGKTPLWLLPGLASLVLFAVLLTRVDAAFAGRAYAAYGGIYILASLVWMWLIEERTPRPVGRCRRRLCVSSVPSSFSSGRAPVLADERFPSGRGAEPKTIRPGVLTQEGNDPSGSIIPSRSDGALIPLDEKDDLFVERPARCAGAAKRRSRAPHGALRRQNQRLSIIRSDPGRTSHSYRRPV